jgi:hypothetical protein
MNSFDTRPSYQAEASHFTATIKAGNLKWTAVIDWKEANKFADPLSFNARPRTTGKYAGAKVIHATNEEALRAQLRQIDPSVKFVAEPSKKTALGTAITMTDSDAKILEGMRTDSSVSDTLYNRACRQFGAPPQKRPDFTVAPTVVTKSPYSETETGELNHAFLQIFLKQHPELKENGHEAFNREILLRWHADSGLRILTLASLERAFQECSALQFFRSAFSGTRTRGQADSNLVRSYSFEAIQAYRRSDEPEQPAQLPAPGSPEEMADRRRVMKLATEHVQNLHPLWKPSSGEFQRELLKTVKEFAAASNPKLGVGKVAHF